MIQFYFRLQKLQSNIGVGCEIALWVPIFDWQQSLHWANVNQRWKVIPALASYTSVSK